MAVHYYHLGEIDKANAIMSQLAENSAEYLEWGASLSKEHRTAAQSTIGHHMAVLGYVLQNLEHFQQEELFDKYYYVYAQYAGR
jgi:hypothetical protein